MSFAYHQFIPKILPWVYDSGIKIIIIVSLAYLVNHWGKNCIARFVRNLLQSERFVGREAEAKRADTLIRIFANAFSLVIVIVALLMIGTELGFQIGPLLAAAGVAGVALGLGGQFLIRDLISGLFLILENQYRIGDVVSFNQVSGVVEDISLRMTTLRDLDGVVHHVPHGEIKIVSNHSKKFARINLNLGVAYTANLDKVIAVVNQVGAELAAEPAWADMILKPPQFLRIEELGDSAIIIKVLGETKPLKQWEVTGELRRRLKLAFDREHIKIPCHPEIVRLARD